MIYYTKFDGAFDFSGKVALITGAANGIGKAAAIMFLASEGANMITGENLVIDGGFTIK